VCVCVYIYIYIYIYIYKTYVQAHLSGPQNEHFNCIVHSTTLQKLLAYTHIFENELFPTSVFQQRQHLNRVGCQIFLVG